MEHDDPLLLDPANDEEDVEEDVLSEETEAVQLQEIGDLPSHVGGDTQDVVEQGVLLQDVIHSTSPVYEEPQC